MKNDTNLVEVILDNLQNRRDLFTSVVLVILVLFIGAGSLYMLLNTHG